MRQIQHIELIGLMFIVLFLGSCAKVDTSAIDNLNGGKITIIGHGGSGFRNIFNPVNMIPANTKSSIDRALNEQQAEGIELDVQLTSDSVIVLYHDKNLNSLTDKEGCINDIPAKDVLGTPYKCGFPYDLFHDESIISLEEVVVKLQQMESFPKLYLDIHYYNYCTEGDPHSNATAFAYSIVALIRKLDIPIQKIVPTSTLGDLLDTIRQLEPQIHVSYEETESFERAMKRCANFGFKSVTIKPSLINKEQVAEAHAKGIEIITFGSRTKSGIAKLIELNPDVLQVDNVPALNELLRGN